MFDLGRRKVETPSGEVEETFELRQAEVVATEGVVVVVASKCDALPK